MYMQPLHLEIPQVPFAGCTMDCIEHLLATSKGHRHALTFICLLTYYLITVPLKTKTVDEVSMAYMKEIICKTSCPKFSLQDNSTGLENEQLMSMFDSLGIKHIYSNPYYPKGNSRIFKFLKRHYSHIYIWQSARVWWYTSPSYLFYNIAVSVNDLESPFYLVHGRDPLEGRLSSLQNYFRYVCDQPRQIVVQKLRKLLKLLTKLLMENGVTKPIDDRKVIKASDLKIV